MWPLLASGLAKAGGSLVNYFTNRNAIKNLPNTPKFENSSYSKYLQNQANTGIYSPLAQQNIINQTSSRASDLAADAKTGYMGRLINRGLGNSIASQRGINEIDNSVTQQVGEAQTNLTTENEMSKVNAGNLYEQSKWQNTLQRYQDKLNKKLMLTQNTGNLVGGLTESATGGLDEAMLMSMLTKRFGGQETTNYAADTGAEPYSSFPGLNQNQNYMSYFKRRYNYGG